MKWLREPLVQFLLIGAALFGIFALWGGPSTAPAGQYHIVITPAMVQNLIVSYQNQNAGRAPTEMELNTLIDNYVHEEIFNREARALGLDQDDTNVRSWLSKRMEFYLEGNAVVQPPTEDQLEAFRQKNAVTFRKDGQLPPLSEIHDQVLEAWNVYQQRQAATAAYDKLRARYTVEVQKSLPSTPTTAPGAAAASGTTDQ